MRALRTWGRAVIALLLVLLGEWAAIAACCGYDTAGRAMAEGWGG